MATPPAADLTVQLTAPDGNAQLPPAVTIPRAAQRDFPVAGVKSGVEEVRRSRRRGI